MDIHINYLSVVIVISSLWLVLRVINWLRQRRIDLKREAELILVYVCIVVVVRFTFFPMARADGKIQPLIFDRSRILPFWLNLKPFVYLFDYPSKREAVLNLVGNVTMFVPLGIVWPSVFKKLNGPVKVLGAGMGFSLCIELFQLLFCERATDIDDLILNTAGFAMGYGIYLLVKLICRKKKC